MTFISRIHRIIAAYMAKVIYPPSESPIEGLPNEIWYLILEMIVGTDPILNPDSYLIGKVPASLCLVNKRFNDFFTPILYYRFDFDGHTQEFPRLWLFLRTIVSRPDLAQHVHAATITTARLGDSFKDIDVAKERDILLKMYKENEKMLMKAAIQAQFKTPHPQREVRRLLRAIDRTPEEEAIHGRTGEHQALRTYEWLPGPARGFNPSSLPQSHPVNLAF
ncbi:hypothetical protein BJX99DRAFT_264093 [Aspergillus californicus]